MDLTAVADLRAALDLGAVLVASLVLTFLTSACLVHWLRPRREASQIPDRALYGSVARVALAIPAGGTGTAVVLDGRGGAWPALECDGGSVPAGALVVVVDHCGSVARVRALPAEIAEDFA